MRLALPALLAFALTPGLAQAERTSPAQATALLEAAGATDLDTTWLDERSVARIDGKHQGYHFSLRLVNCNDQGKCGGGLFFLTFEMPEQAGLETFRKINHYNDTYPFGRAFLIEREQGHLVGVDHAFSLADENRLGSEEVALFFEVVDSFVSHMTK